VSHQHTLDELFDALADEQEELLSAILAEDAELDQLSDDVDTVGGYRAKLTITPRDYQSEALSAWLAAQGRGTIVLPTGAVKTVLALMAIERMKLRTMIVVPTIELLHQWRAAVIERLGVAADKVGVIGDGRREIRPITVITYASAAMPTAPLDGVGLLIFDEAHHLPALAYRTIAERCGAAYRLAITATPERGDGGEDALYQLVGQTVYRRTPEDLAADGHLARFRERRIYVELEAEEALRYGALMSEWKWFVARQRGALAKGGDFFGQLIRRSGNDPVARSALRAHYQARMIALNAEAKIDETVKLLLKHPDDKVLIFSEYVTLVDRVSRELGIPAISYRTAPDERRTTLARFRSGDYRKLVAGRVLNEGVDVPDASVAIVLSGNSTPREHIQRLGRIIRPKPDKSQEATLYELVTRYTSEVATARRRRKR
jgi:superfamily II DNA or RNA helicase